MKRQEKGITLVALVVTIIVLLILAGVAINMVLGENGYKVSKEGGSNILVNLRNNLYLEKLSNEDIENLLSNDSNKKDIVLRTFKDIINIDDGYKVCYGPDTDNFWYDSDILVLGFRFLEFNDNGLSDEAWEEEFYKKRTYLNNMFSSLEASLTEKLGLKVKICEYDEYSIINNKSIEK